MSRYPLASVTVDGFRGLRNLRLDDLGLINVLVGPNNCGKSSVLEALSILCNAFEPFEWLSMIRRRDSGRQDETRIQSLRWCFARSAEQAVPENMFQGECKIFSAGAFPVRRLRVTYHEIEREPYADEGRRPKRRRSRDDKGLVAFQPCLGAQIEHFIDCEGSRSDSSQPVILRVWEDESARTVRSGQQTYDVRKAFLAPYSYQINGIQTSYLSSTVLERRRDDVLDLIQAFDPGVENIQLASFRGGKAAAYIKHRGLGQAPLTVFGDALRKVFLLGNALIAVASGGILLVDGLETGIHAVELQRVLAWLARAARECRVQIVATTHSLDALDAMVLSVPDRCPDVVTFRMEQSERETRTTRIDGELLLRLRRERGLDVR
jgi:AAA ATPase domain